MSKLTRILAALLLVVSWGSLQAQKNAEPTQWQHMPVVADGQTDEYPELSRYLSEIKMLYYIGNNDENLYIVMKTYDNAMMQKLMLAGLEIGLDTTSKKKMRAVIGFPMPRMQAFRRPDDAQQPGERRGGSSERGRFPEPDQMMLKGFIHIPDGETPLQNPSGIQAKVKVKRGEEFVYEAVIPFKTFFKPVLSPKDKDRVISLTFHLPAFERPENMPQQRPMQGERPMGGSRPGSDHGSGAQRGGERPDFELLSTETTIKKLFKLQYNDN